MNARFPITLAAVVGAAVLALAAGAAETPDAPQASGDRGIFDQEAVARSDNGAGQAGVQPQGRGPVHEAFAEPPADLPQSGPPVPKQPPDPIEELPPPEKPEGDDVQWISGYWSWDNERSGFVWVSGIWRATPPGRQWVPGNWAQVQGGWQWSPGYWAAADGGNVVVVPAPPDPPDEKPAAAPTSDSTFVPGNYVYQDNQFVWQPGTYVTNRPGYVWVPAHYVRTPCGYIFVDGYWDYDVQNRGLLFAPVVFDADTLAQPGYEYTPEYVVHDVSLLDALFVRTDCGCYYFGDYFDPAYANLGFVSWFDYRYHRYGFDPLFGYYRWFHRHDRGWESGLRNLFRSRSLGGIGRPPRTLARQQALARNLLANGNRSALQHSVLLGPASRLDRNVVKLQTLDRAGQLQQRRLAGQTRDVGRRRGQAEGRLLSQGRTALGKSGTAQNLGLNLSRSALSGRPGPGRTSPPPTPAGLKTANRLGGNAGGNRLGTGGNPTNFQTGRTNNGLGNTAGRLGGGKANRTPLPGFDSGGKFVPPPNRTFSPGNNSPTGGRLNGGSTRQNITPPGGTRTLNGTPPGGTRTFNGTPPKPPARTFSPGNNSPTGGRTNPGGQQNFRPPRGNGGFNPGTPGRNSQTFSSPPTRTFSSPPARNFSAPPSRTFSSPPSRTFSSPPARTFGGSSSGRTFGGSSFGRTFGGSSGGRTFGGSSGGRTFGGGGGGRTFGGGGGGRRR